MADVINLAFQISADLKGVQSNLRTLEGNFSQSLGHITTMAKGVTTVLSGLGVGLGAGAAVGFVKSAVTGAAALQDLSDQSGITAENLAVLKLAGIGAGQGIEESVAAVIKLQRTLIESRTQGTDPTNKGLRALKLSAKELADALTDPNKLLEIIPQKLANLSNQAQRNAVAMDIAGRSGYKLAATLLDLAANQEKYRASIGLTNQQIKDLDTRLDQSAQAWEVLKFHVAGAAVELAKFLGLIGESQQDKFNSELLANTQTAIKLRVELERLVDAKQKALVEPQHKEQFTKDNQAAIDKTRAELDRLAKERDKIQQGIRELNKPPTLAPPPGVTDEAALKRQQTFIDGLKKQAAQFGINNAELLTGKDLAAELNAQFEVAGGKTTNSAFIKWRDQVVALNEEMIRTKLFVEQIGTGIDQSDMDFGKAKADEISSDRADVVRLRKQIEDSNRARLEIVAPDEDPGGIFANAKIALDGLNESMNRQLQIEFDLSEQMKNIEAQALAFGVSFDKSAAQVAALTTATQALLNEGLSPLGPAIKEKTDQIKQLSDSTKAAATVESLIRGGAQGISDSLRSIAFGTQTVGEAFSNMGLAAVAAIQNVIFELLVLEPLIKGLKAGFEGKDSGGGNIFGTIGGFIGKLFGAGFAEGGIVPGPIGAPQLAKVHGGETIVPTHKMGSFGGGTVNNYIDARGAQRGVSQEIRRAIDESRQAAVRQSVGAVQEERRRSNNMAKMFSR